MQNELRRVADAAWRIVLDPRANRLERIEALKLILACKGVLIPEVNESWVSVKQALGLRKAKQQLLELALRRKERKARVNRKHYLKKRIAALENGQEGHDERIEGNKIGEDEVGTGSDAEAQVGAVNDIQTGDDGPGA